MRPSLRRLAAGFLLVASAALARAVDVPMAETQVHEFNSAFTGRRYQLRIGLPRNYDPARRRYPVVYQLDGQWDFDRVFPLARALEYDRRMEPVIVAAITYGGVNPDYGALRQKDYTPVDFLGGGQTGDAAKFLQTVRAEIVPLVEATYACRSDERILMGSSYGGLFTCYALLHAPDLFTGYVASSPSIWVGSYLLVQEAQAATPVLAGRNLRVRIVTGANETYTQRYGAQTFYDALTALRLPGLNLRLTFAPDERHGAVAGVAYNEGLPQVMTDKLVLFGDGPGEAVGWSATQPAVAAYADRMLRYAGPVSGAVRRVAVFEPTAGAITPNVRGVAYVLDAQWDARHVEASYGGLIYDGDFLPLLRAGIDWEGGWGQISDWRNREFTPSDPTGSGAFGGAETFRTLLRERIRPDVEANLAGPPGFRLVFASEKAALWALTDLLSEQPSFDRYLLVSPAVEWDDEWLLKLEQTRAARGGNLAARVLIYQGEREDPVRTAALERFVARLAARGYPGLTLQKVVRAGAGYAETKMHGYHKGYRLLGP